MPAFGQWRWGPLSKLGGNQGETGVRVNLLVGCEKNYTAPCSSNSYLSTNSQAWARNSGDSGVDSMWSGVAGVVIGWLLVQASTVLVQLHERRRTKRALLDELGELSESLDNWENRGQGRLYWSSASN